MVIDDSDHQIIIIPSNDFIRPEMISTTLTLSTIDTQYFSDQRREELMIVPSKGL